MTEDKAIAPLIPPVGEDDPLWQKVQSLINEVEEGGDWPPTLADRLRDSVDAALTLTRQQHASDLNAAVCESEAIASRAEEAIAHIRKQHAEQIAEKDRLFTQSITEMLMHMRAAESSEAALQADLTESKANYTGACATIAKMHEAAMGEVTGPKRGVVEDIADLRAELETVTTDRDFHKGQHEKWVAVASRNGVELADTTDALTETRQEIETLQEQAEKHRQSGYDESRRINMGELPMSQEKGTTTP